MAFTHWAFASCILLQFSVSCVSGSNFLIMVGAGEGSHFHITSNIAVELHKREHNVTMLAHDIWENKLRQDTTLDFVTFHFFTNHDESVVGLTLKVVDDFFSNVTRAGLQGEPISWFVNLVTQTNFTERMIKDCHNLLGDEELINVLKEAKYDLTLVDTSYACPIMQYLGRPYVALHPMLVTPFNGNLWRYMINRVPFNPAYMPEHLTELDQRMTFTQRLLNLAYHGLYFVIGSLPNPFGYVVGEIGEMYNISVEHDDFATAELWLMNTHFALDFPRPLLPNTIPVGGLTSGPAKPLSRDWEDFLQSAGEDGVVLFSTGTYARDIGAALEAKFARAFAQLPQKVIWKLNGKPPVNLPSNVKVEEWLPQNDLLGHPQVKVFVYHCGMNGVWEAVYHGVPIVAVPLFDDQFDNAQRIVSRGMGVKLDITTLTSNELADAVVRVATDPSFKANATRVSAIFRDTPRAPIEKAVDWMEYAVRHKGARHQRSAALDLNIIQYFLLDVILTFILGLAILVGILIFVCRLCFKGCKKYVGYSSKMKSD